jgi:Protein of unknown function (DUF1592)/Protein of unknown function (DUF1588)/Protein of unknown function (DUF1587)/Protein of unknown function (DUF1585)/Protein of unknown function (DUF1595)/Planctomycete cytochrome C
MKKGLFLLAVLMGMAAWPTVTVPQAASLQGPPSNGDTVSAPHAAVIKQYCVTCHNERLKTAGLILETKDVGNIPADAEVWEKVLRKLQTGAMPPQGARRPDQPSYERLIAWLTSELDRGAAAHPNSGKPLLHRLNRTEYANAIRDLLALDVADVESLLPADDAAYGFDNIADVLGVSPLLVERYLDAAGKISGLAVGTSGNSPVGSVYRVRQDLSQDQHIEALPLGTVGGTLVRHTFPLDGEYEFRVQLFRIANPSITRGLEYPHQLEITVDGERVHLATVGEEADLAALYDNTLATSDAVDARLRVRVRVKAGQRTVGVAFLQSPPTQDTRRLEPFLRSTDLADWTGRPHIETLTIIGPFNATGPGDTASRRRIFTCRPVSRLAHRDCARRILSTLARRAYRQPVSVADFGRLMRFYEEGRRKGGFEAGVELALRRVLASPKFVFRLEADPEHVAPGTPYRISDLELASRLSFFLWSSIPDDELLRVASQGMLRRPTVLIQQVRRMLTDTKSEALVRNFAGQWLQLRNLRNVLPNSEEFPDFDDNLRQALRRETELLFDSIVREDRNVLDLLTADYTFVNERLAKHYGIPHVYGSHFRRVPVTDGARKGLLGQGSILTLTSHAQRTSPVLRGKWVLENLLGTPPPPPPPNVPALEEQTGSEQKKPRSMREQMEAHRANPVCASCHRLMDPIGFALEHFDAVGASRTRDGGVAIDASGLLLDGSKLDGVVTLRQALLRRSDVLVTNMTEKLLTYALGRGVAYYDMPAVRAIVREAAGHNYRFSSIMLGIVTSLPFQMRMKPSTGSGEPAARTAAR